MFNSANNNSYDFEKVRRAFSIHETIGDTTLTMYPNNIFIESQNNVWVGEWHKHSFSELIVLFSGEEYIEFENGTHVILKPHDICIIPAKVAHKCSPYSQNQSWFSFLINLFSDNPTQNSLLNIFSHIISPANSSYVLIQNDSAYNTIENILSILKSDHPLRELLFKYQVLHFVMQCFNTAYIQSTTKKNRLDCKLSSFYKDSDIILLQQIEYFIISNYATCTIESLAKYINRSIRQTERIITQHFGLSFKEVLTNQRIFSAQRLLLEGKKINFVSDYVGYKTLDGFRKAFKKETGITPKGFVKKYVIQNLPFTISEEPLQPDNDLSQ